MNQLPGYLVVSAIALSWAASAFTIAAALIFLTYMKRPRARPITPLSVTILKPLHQDANALPTHLWSFLNQVYDGPSQIVCGVHSENDPAVNSLAEFNASKKIELIVNTSMHGANPKISNLMNIYTYAAHDILAVTDSDIVVSEDWLSVVVGALDEPGVGAVSCLYRGRAAGGVWAKLAAMGISYQFLPSAAFGVFFDLARPCFGSTIVLRKGTLDRIGGFRAFADSLADDYEIGRAVMALGYKVALPSITVEHICSETTASELFHHEVRWNRTIRALHPLGYLGTIIAQPVPLSIVTLLVAGLHPITLIGILIALLARAFLKLCVDVTTKTASGPLLLLPIHDVIHFGIFLISLFGHRIRWGALTLLMSNGGRSVRLEL